jgi:hypothetical protein
MEDERADGHDDSRDHDRHAEAHDSASSPLTWTFSGGGAGNRPATEMALSWADAGILYAKRRENTCGYAKGC